MTPAAGADGRPRVLVTNDDGVHAPGLTALAQALVDGGCDVVVVAPDDDRSGSGAGIGPVRAGEGIQLVAVELEGLHGVPAYGIGGPPALAVMAARLGAFGEPPVLVASGVNPGHNTGRSVLHSGTVGAALTAANFGVSGLAVSLGFGEPLHLDTAGAVAVAATRWILGAPARTVLNVNVPNLPLDDVAGVRWARLAPFGTVRAALADGSNGRLQIELQATDVELDPDTDTALVGAGYVTVTGLTGLRATERTDAAETIAAELRSPATTS